MKNFIRWIIAWPSGILAAWLGYRLIAFKINWFFTGWFISPDTLIAKITTVFFGSVTMGVIYLISAIYVVPRETKGAVIWLTLSAIIPAAVLSVFSWYISDYWAVFNFVVFAFTCGIVGWYQIKEIRDPLNERSYSKSQYNSIR